MFAGHSLGGAVGAVMAGWIFDSFARYDWTWIVGLALALLAAILAWSVPEKRDKARDDSVPAGAAA
jgi:predicted MFS family arabinose efflux permease